ncbi:MAG: hypothetical protein Q8L64_01020 [bacterium]|nr:hypothetical protein [bacterium]
MPEYNNYPRDIWEYVKDLPYMPSRADREKLFRDENKRERVKLWDYFFRIKPEDVGKPQRAEISFIIKNIRISIKKCKQREQEILERIKELEKSALIKVVKRLAWGIAVLVSVLFIVSRISTETISVQDKYIYGAAFFLFWLIVMAVFVGLGYLVGGDKKESKRLAVILQEFKGENLKEIDEARNRISNLKKEVARLRRQLPMPLSGEEVRKWLNGEFEKLWNYAKTEVALIRDIISIQGDQPDVEIKNPLTVLGPGELQPEIPRHFSVKINKDLHKHIGAKQAYQVDPGKYGVLYDVLYGVYFFEYIVVAADMLVTHSFFYDFIDDKVTTEYTTEQYYTDVVALAIEEESRKITTLNRMGKLISMYIDDSPAFTLSLKSGEKHKVAFVSQEYFMKVSDKLEISHDDVDKIFWINQAKKVADNVIKALRSYLRKHKAL